MDWNTKNARLEFDEGVVSAQGVASSIAQTAHMMGRDMRYGGWLAISVPDLNDEASAKKAVEAITKVKGVTRVAPYVKEHAIGVSFDGSGKDEGVTTKAVIDALDSAGFSRELLS